MQNWETPELLAAGGVQVECLRCGSVFFSTQGQEAAEAMLNEHMRSAHKGSDSSFGGNDSGSDNYLPTMS